MPALQLMALFALKKSENSKPVKVFHLKKLRELFPDFSFEVAEDLFHDASQDGEILTGN